ncbi:MAG: hypothetical protein HQ536_01545 [Parcubacteria group bacterium]|nr:hypothetical protein [Parcubacteria group bacterium]
MPKKGTTNNPAGRPAGTPNKLTKEIRQSLKNAIGGHIEQIGKDLDVLPAKDRLEILTRLLAFILPKVQPLTSNYDSDFEIFGE